MVRLGRFSFVLLVGLFTLVAPLAAVAAPGDLDASYSGDGKAVANWPGRSAWMNAVLARNAGILTAGMSRPGESADSDFGLVKWRTDGALDTSFSVDGRAVADFLDADDEAVDILGLSKGAALAAGWAKDGNGLSGFALAKFRANGTLDTGFSGDGKVRTTFAAGSALLTDAEPAAEGDIVGIGSVSGAIGLARWNGDGTIDSGFGGGDGRAVVDLGPETTLPVRGFRLSTGKIVVAGQLGDDLFMARVNGGGTVDATFGGGDGFGTIGLPAAELLAVQDAVRRSDGRVVVLARFTPQGETDTRILLARFTAAGAPDTTFGGGDGWLVSDPTADQELMRALKLHGDVLYVLGAVGASESDADATVLRYLQDGTLDATFSTDGVDTIALGVASNWNGAQFDPTGRLVVAGRSFDGVADSDPASARYLTT